MFYKKINFLKLNYQSIITSSGTLYNQNEY